MEAQMLPLGSPKAVNVNATGGKAASLARIRAEVSGKGIPVPDGFVVTTEAYWEFLAGNHLDSAIADILSELDREGYLNLQHCTAEIRKMILAGELPERVKKAVEKETKRLERGRFAVRSSATAEDLDDASFAGMHDSFLNVKPEEIVDRIRMCYASLYSDRAVRYRAEHGIESARMAVLVQEMVDAKASGVAFTLDPDSGFKDVVVIEAVPGLGEALVHGRCDPDEYMVHKPKLSEGKKPIIGRRLGLKRMKTKLSDDGVAEAETTEAERVSFTLRDPQILELARKASIIEGHYGKPMDVEWALDGRGRIMILQARPITACKGPERTLDVYTLPERGKVLCEGIAVGKKIGAGRVKAVLSQDDFTGFSQGEVLVTEHTTPDFMHVIMKAAAVITEKGGRTSHAAIVARELGIPCVVGAKDATKKLKDGMAVTVSCVEERGRVYEGLLAFKVAKKKTSYVKTRTKVLMNVNLADASFKYREYCSDGVGMVREEYLIVNGVGVHPSALIEYGRLKEELSALEGLSGRYEIPAVESLRRLIKTIEDKSRGYESPKEYYVEALALQLGRIAAAFHPREVIVKLTDLKSNEYRGIPGGSLYEPKETNPLVGFRSAVRYYSREYGPAFRLECEAMRKVREDMGFTNVHAMIPFCRTPEEGEKVLDTLKENGLPRSRNGFKVIAEVEVPSSIILLEEYAGLFDGFQIGSNCLTQSILCLDRDSPHTSHLFDERHPAMKKAISEAIRKAHECGKTIGIVGQAPSDYPDFTEFLVKEGIDAISLNPDPETFIKMREKIAEAEEKTSI